MLTWNFNFQFSYVMTLFFCFHKKYIHVYIYVAILVFFFYKKNLMHNLCFQQTRCQDIMSHQTMIDSVTDKGTALSSAQVKGKLKELSNSYKSLCHAAQAQVKTAEQQVDQHQTFADSSQQCKDWITMSKDKLAVCNEVSGDKQTLQNRLDRVKVTIIHHLFYSFLKSF